MAGINYKAMADTVKRLLSANGRGYLVKRAPVVSRDENGVEVKTPGAEFKTTGVITNYSLAEYAKTVIQGGDVKLICIADVPLLSGDVVDVDGVKYRIVNPNPIQPGNTRLGYKAQLRRQ